MSFAFNLFEGTPSFAFKLLLSGGKQHCLGMVKLCSTAKALCGSSVPKKKELRASKKTEHTAKVARKASDRIKKTCRLGVGRGNVALPTRLIN